MKRCTTIIRAAAFMLVALALWAMPSSVRAQDDVKCVCDHYTIALDKALTCKVTVCYQVSPLSKTICNTYGPGDEITIPCPVYQASIGTCDGGSVVVISSKPSIIARCTDIFHIASDCCARACRTSDEKGCPLVRVTAVPCFNDLCP